MKNLAFSSIILAGCCAVLPIHEVRAFAPPADRDADLRALHDDARKAAAERDFVTVEYCRRRRLDLVEEFPEGSPWRRGGVALKQADALVDELRYRDAIEVLREAWKPFADGSAGPVAFGDLAVRLFEVSQQAVVTYRDALDDDDPDHVTTTDELRRMIDFSVANDPCQVEAHAISAYLTDPDPRERYLRAEVRPSLKERNSQMVGLSFDVEATPSGPVMPWHAPVEHVKAGNSKAVLLGDLKPVNEFLDPYATLRGTDANGAPFTMLFRRWMMLMEMPDKQGIPRPANMLVDEGRWRRMHVRLLWRKPRPEALDKDNHVRTESEFFERLAPLQEWRISGREFAVYDLPVAEAEFLFRDSLATLIVRNVSSLEPRGDAKRFSPRDFAKLLLRGTSPTVWATVGQSVQRNDVTKSPLVELSEAPGMNPLLVMSFDGEKGSEPAFFRDDYANNPYLRLDDGGTLEYDAERNEYLVSMPGLKGHVPLQMRGIPEPLLRATAAGDAIARILQAAGYSQAEAFEQINFDDPSYVPPKFKSFLASRARSTRTSPDAVFAELLREHGWTTGSPLVDLAKRFKDYGFRYFTLEDDRQSFVTNPFLLGDMPREYLYDVRDFRTGEPVDRQNRYTVNDYVSLYANVRNIFHPSMVAYQPSLPAARQCLEWAGVAPSGSEELRLGYSTANDRPGKQVRVPDFRFPPWDEHDAELRDMLDSLNIQYVRSGFAQISSRQGNGWPVEKVGEPDRKFLWLQLRVAREAVKKEWPYREPEHHKALAICNDIVDSIRPTEKLNVALFEKVPNPAEMKAFAEMMENLVQDQAAVMLVQAEQGSVLASAGLTPSAVFAWETLGTQHRYYVQPMIEEAVEYGKSYGFSPPPQFEQALQSMKEIMEQVTNQLALVRRVQGEDAAGGKWPRTDAEADASCREATARLKALLTVDPKTEQPPAVAKGVSATFDDILRVPMSFEPWLEFRRLLVDLAPGSLARTRAGALACWRFAPMAAYDENEGFLLRPERLLEAGPAKRCAELIRSGNLPSSADAAAADDAEAYFLLAWHLADRGEPGAARSCAIAAARCFLARGGDANDFPALVARRNAIMMLVAAAGLVDPPPGVDAYKTEFLDTLRVQAVMWKRRAYAKGMRPSHVDAEVAAGVREMSRIGNALRRMNAKRTVRYYFVDYRERFGALPDIVVADAIRYRGDQSGGPAADWVERFFKSTYPTPTSTLYLDSAWLQERLKQRQKP